MFGRWLKMRSCGQVESFDAITVGVGLRDMALWQNLTQNMKLSTERKETEVKE